MVVSEATGVRKHVPNDQEKMSWWNGLCSKFERVYRNDDYTKAVIRTDPQTGITMKNL